MGPGAYLWAWDEKGHPELPTKSLIDNYLNLAAGTRKVNLVAGGPLIRTGHPVAPSCNGPASYLERGNPSGRAADSGAFRNTVKLFYSTGWHGAPLAGLVLPWPFFTLTP